MKRHSSWLMGFVLLAVAGGLHFWFHHRSARNAGEQVETVGQLSMLIDSDFQHDGESIQIVRMCLQFPYTRMEFITSAEQVGRLERLRGRWVRVVTTRHDGRNGRLVSIEEAAPDLQCPRRMSDGG